MVIQSFYTHLGINLLVFLHDKLVTALGCAIYTKPKFISLIVDWPPNDWSMLFDGNNTENRQWKLFKLKYIYTVNARL